MKKTLIIAEAGINHNGDIKKAMKLIDAAKFSGADVIKFQTFIASSVATPDAPKAKYQIDNSIKYKKENMSQMLKKYQLTFNNFKILRNYCKKKKIEFLSSGFDRESLIFLKKLKMKRFKIPSGEINNIPLLEQISSFGLKVLLSTGMSTYSEIEFAYRILRKKLNKNKITIMHCNSAYPTPFEDSSLLTIRKLERDFKTSVGYSDHTMGYEACISAATLGAKVIEKHFTLNNNLPGPDHKISLDPKNFGKMVTYIRNIEKGLYEKIHISKSEKKNINFVRRSIFARTPIKKGDKFSEKNLILKRPANGLSPIYWKKIMRLKAKKNYSKNEKITRKIFNK